VADEDRLAALEARLQAVENELAITRVIVQYGFAVDTGDAKATSSLFTLDATFDVDDTFVMEGRAAIEAMVNGDLHQSMLPNCAHTIGPVVVYSGGERAVAIGYSRIYRRADDRLTLFRIGCNRWELLRDSEGWKIDKRTTRVLGTEEAQAVLHAGLGDIPQVKSLPPSTLT
jgi:ketosteroid isomerase-like protein